MDQKKDVYLDANELNVQKEFMATVKARNEARGKPLFAYMVTYGCQQNESDTEKLRGMAANMGYTLTSDLSIADLIIYNTCAVRENAELKVFGNLGALKHTKAKRPDTIIGVCGCMMQQEHIAARVKQKYKHVDMVFGTHALYKFPELLNAALTEQHMIIDIEDSYGKIAEDVPIKRDGAVKAWVSIMYGCNNFCSYCIVPYVRGRERSRMAEHIYQEIRTLAKEGFKEITLLGQNVNSYGKDLDIAFDFSDLLKNICEIDGTNRIRFVTSHPKDLSDKLICTIRDNKKICAQLHLPFQAGNDKILKLMNRGYTKAEYLALIKRVKQEIPDIALTTDVIVGFPGEGRQEFLDTLEVLRQVRFDTIFSFIYSKRKGTPAYDMEDVISKEEKHENFNELLAVQNQISREINEGYGGKTLRVLVEGVSKTDPTKLSGRTDSGKVVNFAGEEALIGSFCEVLITNVQTWSLGGVIVK